MENQFIQFNNAIFEFGDSEIAVPTGKATQFYFSNAETDRRELKVDIVTPDGGIVIKENAASINGAHITIYSPNIAPRDCYRLHVVEKYEDGYIEEYYSNLLVKEDDAQYAEVRYSCKEPAFGFPFDGTGYVLQLMPINLHSPQFKQEDKVYTKRNGEQVVLFASITKEYEGETDYIPMEWHEKILMALSCDEVYINREKVTKSGNYEIDHDNCTYSDCGIKLMRATFKVTTNVTQRNSNY
jgi:hypothetical protein